MRTDTPATIYRQDYRPYPFAVQTVELTFDLEPSATLVRNQMAIARQVPGGDDDLVLDGEDLELVSVAVDGKQLTPDRYQITNETLTIRGIGSTAKVEVITRCKPESNSTLMGLYVSNGVFFTQCEAQGFRRITYFPDRPDVLTVYTVTLRANRDSYPTLLSNGNLVHTAELPDGRHEARWHDPFPKPSYLFALVAGTLAVREKRVQTRSGREVLLQVYCDPGNEPKTEWALDCLERAMRWDETRFNLELDLDRFMIVAAHDFNMGAMENKGLNIFNAAYVLADPATATDANYSAIEAVIGHEYFHNWTGNRVTCRDWFQLSLKEGLTVFREQEFSADMKAVAVREYAPKLPHDELERAESSARAVKRIDDVLTLRASQFPEDAGPMAHPIRPESYQEISNFYTATIYEKGAEVIRMQHTLLGEVGFQQGFQEYLRRHDGRAATCDDFIDAMESVYKQQQPGRDLSVFRRWYNQAGTPRVRIHIDHDAASQRVTITAEQSNPPVGIEKLAGGEFVKPPLHIPLAVGLLSPQGDPLPLRLAGQPEAHDTLLLELTEKSQQWVFEQVAERPVPSLLRNFSAPVVIEYDYSDTELALLFARDTNAFTRWEAGQELAIRHLFRIAQALRSGDPLPESTPLIEAWRAVLLDTSLDPAWKARALSLPSERILAERTEPVDPQSLAEARDHVRAELGSALLAEWHETVATNQTPGPYSPDPLSAGKRDLKNLALIYLMTAGDSEAAAAVQAQFDAAPNMTDTIASLSALVNFGPMTLARDALASFYAQWQHDPLVIDKWFALQASARTADVAQIRELMQHPAFVLRNPNRVRAVIFQFCLNNPRAFHQESGEGYQLWRECVLALDSLNPEIAARLARGLEQYRRYIPVLRDGMAAALNEVRLHADLSRNVVEVVSKALEISA